MNDPERQLNEMKPAAPSEEFERRMATLFEEVTPRPAIWRRGVAVWQAVAACLLCGFSGFAASNFLNEQSPLPEPEIRTEYYMIPAQGPVVRSAFDVTEPPQYQEASSSLVQVVIETFDSEQQS
jgi:hypothetical protein